MQKKLVIFDFDGVLVESLDLWFRVTQTVSPGLNREEYVAMSHGNYIDAFVAKNFSYTEESLEEYKNNLLTIAMPLPVHVFIKNHHETYQFAIVSSGRELTIDAFLTKENVREYFTDILGYETHKNKTVKLLDLLSKYGSEAKDAVFVTDTLGDILEANEAGIKSIGVLWGLHDRETLAQGNPEFIIENPTELEKTIEKVLES